MTGYKPLYQVFCFVDRQMGTPQWSDLGMFLQTFMLLAREEGLDTCPQEAWAHASCGQVSNPSSLAKSMNV